jgi:hypothetical protein
MPTSSVNSTILLVPDEHPSGLHCEQCAALSDSLKTDKTDDSATHGFQFVYYYTNRIRPHISNLVYDSRMPVRLSKSRSRQSKQYRRVQAFLIRIQALP